MRPVLLRQPFPRLFDLRMLLKPLLVIAIMIALAGILAYLPEGGLAWQDCIIAGLALQPMMIVGSLLISARHAMLVRPLSPPYLETWFAVILSAGLNIVVPARLSEFVKISYLREREAIPFHVGTSAIIVERLMDIVVVSAIGVAGLAVFFGNQSVLFVAILIFSSLVLLGLRPIGRLANKWIGQSNNVLALFLARVAEAATSLSRRQLVQVAMPLTVLSWFATFVGIYLFLYLLPDSGASLGLAAALFVAVIAASAIPALPAGLGSFEAAAVLILQQAGHDFSYALTAAVSLHLAQLFMSASLAPVILLIRKTGVSDLMRSAMSALKSNTPES